MTGDRRNPEHRSSTDESLRVERTRTDDELEARSEAIRDVATDEVARARQQADSVLNNARQAEDRKTGESATIEVDHERAREDAVLHRERLGADVVARDESERRRLALASLLAYERESTDLQLESERDLADEAVATREDFMALVSHDLRSLLGGIALSAELLNQLSPNEAVARASVKQYSGSILRFAARMNRLVGDLMDVSSIESGKLGVKPVRLAASLVLREAMEAFGPAARAQDIELSYVPTDAGHAHIDQERILQVLTNLVGNSLKFTPKGGTIELRADRTDNWVRFSVSDTGEGVPRDMLQKIFDRYVQTKPADRRGLGLGLFIAKSIVTQHGGTIGCTSEPGKGSTFYFTVPAR